jgi:hypothetical protein
MKTALLYVLVVIVFAASEVRAAEPCCGVTAVDARSGVVTARQTATGRTFQFKLDDTSLASAIKVGQTVEADFQTGKVTVRPAESEPCCNIASIDAATGVVTLRANVGGRTSQLTVRDARLLGTLKVGQTVDANTSTGSIAIAPTGSIVK